MNITRNLFAASILSLIVVPALTSETRAQTSDVATYKVGVAARHVFSAEPYDWRGSGSRALQEVIWYPAETGAEPKPQLIPPVGQALFEAAPAAPEAKPAANPAKFPLILLSHGTGGTAQSMAWLATALAARGYIVAAVNHPGNTAIEPYTVQGFSLWWLRAKDISAVLDDILADRDFGPHVDAQRIGAAGFSLGGYTVIELAGGVTSRQQFDQYCKTGRDSVSCKAPPEFPDLLAEAKSLAAGDPAFAAALAGAGQSYRDPRIRAVFAIAPAIGPAVTARSLAAIEIPVAIVAGAGDSIVPVAANARYYANIIPRVALTVLPGDVDHYTFVDVCTDFGRISIPQLCVDRGAANREAVHAETIDIAAKFFNGHL
jgi:predicted dienelactone hydrolase